MKKNKLIPLSVNIQEGFLMFDKTPAAAYSHHLRAVVWCVPYGPKDFVLPDEFKEYRQIYKHCAHFSISIYNGSDVSIYDLIESIDLAKKPRIKTLKKLLTTP